MEQGWVWGKRAETEPRPAGVSGGWMLMLPGLWHLGFSTRGAGISHRLPAQTPSGQRTQQRRKNTWRHPPSRPRRLVGLCVALERVLG